MEEGHTGVRLAERDSPRSDGVFTLPAYESMFPRSPGITDFLPTQIVPSEHPFVFQAQRQHNGRGRGRGTANMIVFFG